MLTLVILPPTKLEKRGFRLCVSLDFGCTRVSFCGQLLGALTALRELSGGNIQNDQGSIYN